MNPICTLPHINRLFSLSATSRLSSRLRCSQARLELRSPSQASSLRARGESTSSLSVSTRRCSVSCFFLCVRRPRYAPYALNLIADRLHHSLISSPCLPQLARPDLPPLGRSDSSRRPRTLPVWVPTSRTMPSTKRRPLRLTPNERLTSSACTSRSTRGSSRGRTDGRARLSTSRSKPQSLRWIFHAFSSSHCAPCITSYVGFYWVVVTLVVERIVLFSFSPSLHSCLFNALFLSSSSTRVRCVMSCSLLYMFVSCYVDDCHIALLCLCFLVY